MSYTLLVKTNKKTANKCLDCNKCEVMRIDKCTGGKLVRCSRPDIINEFWAKDYTCKTYDSVSKKTNYYNTESPKPNNTENKYELTDKDKRKYKQTSLVGG